MKKIPSKHASHEMEHHNFISLISLILLFFGLLFLLYLLAFCHLSDEKSTPLICHASAKEKRQEKERNEISEAAFLSRNAIHQISLSPYGHRYYYIVFQENCTLNILSGSASIQVTCYSQNGSQMRIPEKNHQYYFEKASGNTLSPGDRIFIKFASISTKPCAIKVQYKMSFPKNAEKNKTFTPKPKKVTHKHATRKPAPKATSSARKILRATPKPSPATKKMPSSMPRPSQIIKKMPSSIPRPSPTIKKMPSSTPRPSPTTKKIVSSIPKPSAAIIENVPDPTLHANPHFLQLAVGTKKEFSLSLGKTSLSLSDCTYFLTDSTLLSIHGNTILGKKEGVTVLYFQEKKYATCSCCLIRITKNI